MLESERTSVWRSPVRLESTSFDWKQPIPQQGCFFTKQALEHVGGIDTTFDLSMDFDLWMRLFDNDVRHTYVPEVLATFEIHQESKTGSRGYEEFLREGARALAKNGRPKAAAVMLGQAAAEVYMKGDLLSRTALKAVAKAELATADIPAATPRLVMAGAAARLALTAARSQEGKRAYLRALRGMSYLEPWTFPLTRQKSLLAVRTVLKRLFEDAIPRHRSLA